ncbi:hypothetical protein R3P38DRAFT_2584970 [Favolaschia claudopus]|uniref:Uncharacterized protein n=1 Tax=Favolaschia claudopus TaxID=2862362 RepID=A0AAV9Z6W6_9AGAR
MQSTTTSSKHIQGQSPSLPILNLNPAKNTRSNSEASYELITLSDALVNGDEPSINCRVVNGFDLDLFILFVNGGLALCWGLALLVFQTGVVPVNWSLSKIGQNHLVITNVIITGFATAFTMHLNFAINSAVRECAAMAALAGLNLQQWHMLQAMAQVGFKPPFEAHKHWLLTAVWLIVVAGMGAHTTSQVAILQPEYWIDHVMFNDSMPCGIDPQNLTLNSVLLPQPDFDRLAFQFGMQLGNYYDQVAANTTTAAGRNIYVKDNFAYGGLGGLINGRQQVSGAEIIARCGSNDNGSYPNTPLWRPLVDLWADAFPQHNLPSVDVKNGIGLFSSEDNIISSTQASVASGPNFTLSDGQVGLYGLVNATGSGGVLTVDSGSRMVGCVWTVQPKLVFNQRINWTFVAIPQETINATTVPFPVGRGVLSTIQGMAAAVQHGAHLTHTPFSSHSVDMHIMLQTLLADALKAVFTTYTQYSRGLDETKTGAGLCFSGNRTDQIHWRFGNQYYLGWISIVCSIVFGLIVLLVVVYLRSKPRVKKIDLLQVADAFTLGVYAIDKDIDHRQMLSLQHGRMASL